ncbi:MAG: dTDP-4-dehydrorhamnose reductase [Deferrisomatales bacterium]
MTGHPTLALIGAKGMLAGAVARGVPAGWRVVGYDLPELDLADRDGVLRTLEGLGPEVIVNCAAYTDVDGCEAREDLANRVNGEGPGHLAEAARRLDAVLVHLSTDYVFDGTKNEPYVEDDPPSPLGAYGRSKLLGEQRVLASGHSRCFVVRTSWLYGPGGKNFVETIARLAGEREELRVVADQVGCPTYTEDLARALVTLLALVPTSHGTGNRAPPYGIYHFSNEGSCSWHGFALEITARLRERGPVRARAVLPISTAEYPTPARRPPYSILSKQKYITATGQPVPHWKDGLTRYFESRKS